MSRIVTFNLSQVACVVRPSPFSSPPPNDMMDDTPPVAHISSDNEDDESAKNPSAKGSEVRQRGCVYSTNQKERRLIVPLSPLRSTST